MSEMEHDVSAQRAKTEHLDGACRCLSDQNWSQGQVITRKDQRIKELKEEMLAVKASIEDQQVNHCSLNITVVDLQGRVGDLENRIEWINGLHNEHSTSLDDFSVRLDNTKETLEEFEGNWKKYNQDQKWNILMAHINSQHRYVLQRKLDMVELKVSNVEELLMREIHCSHCPSGDGETIGNIPCEVSGWEPQYQPDFHLSEYDVEDCIREDEAETSWRMWGEEEEIEEEPIVIGTPISIISQEGILRPILPLDMDLGEPEVIGSPESTQATSVPDKKVVPLPVVRGVVQSSHGQRYSPYATPPSASSTWTSAH